MTVRVEVSPDVLGWALDRARDPDAITRSMPNVLEWLSGDSQPTVKQLAKFAARTGTPFGYLLLQRPPNLTLPVPDFREGFGGSALGDPSPDLLAVVHQSIRRQDWYRDYAIENGLPEVEVVGSAEGMSPVEAAADMRAALGYEVAQRRGALLDVHAVRHVQERPPLRRQFHGIVAARVGQPGLQIAVDTPETRAVLHWLRGQRLHRGLEGGFPEQRL